MNTSAAVLFMLGLATLATCSEASWGPIWGPQPRLRIRRLGRYGSRVPYNQAQARRYQAMNDHPKESCMARCERKFSQSGQRVTEKCLYRCGLPPSDAAEEKLDAVEPWDGYTEYSRGSFVTYRWGGQTKTYRKISSQCMPYPQANAWICNSPYRDRDNWEEIEREDYWKLFLTSTNSRRLYIPYNWEQAQRYQSWNDHPKSSCMTKCERKFTQSGQRVTEMCLAKCGLPPSAAAEEKIAALESWDGYTEYSRGSFVTYRSGGQTKTYRKTSSQCMPYPRPNAWICNSPRRDQDNWEELTQRFYFLLF